MYSLELWKLVVVHLELEVAETPSVAYDGIVRVVALAEAVHVGLEVGQAHHLLDAGQRVISVQRDDSFLVRARIVHAQEAVARPHVAHEQAIVDDERRDGERAAADLLVELFELSFVGQIVAAVLPRRLGERQLRATHDHVVDVRLERLIGLLKLVAQYAEYFVVFFNFKRLQVVEVEMRQQALLHQIHGPCAIIAVQNAIGEYLLLFKPIA